jgi:hypothetical protein
MSWNSWDPDTHIAINGVLHTSRDLIHMIDTIRSYHGVQLDGSVCTFLLMKLGNCNG